MRRVCLLVALAGIAPLVVSSASAAAALPGTSLTASPLTGNLLVLLDRHVSAVAHGGRQAEAEIARAGAVPGGKSVPQIGLMTVRPSRGLSLAALTHRLLAIPGVASVQLERRYVPRQVPNDPALSTTSPDSGAVQWALGREGFYDAWDITHGDGATVGVVDTGVDASHPDLKAKLAVAPVDQQQSTDSTGPAGTDQVGHGTHVASLACADTNNAIGMAGAGYDCKLVIEKTDFTDSSIAASIVDATDKGVQAINMSFGPDSSNPPPAPQSEVRALQYAAAHKVVLVAAAADNPGTEQGDPANVLQPAGTGPNITQGLGLDVTAADYSGGRASFAGFGSEISVAAYGAFEPDQSGALGLGPPPGIFGAFPANSTQLESLPEPCLCRTTFQGSSNYAYLQGTSMAAPQVAALGAVIRALNPFATLSQVLGTIKQTAQRPAGTGFNSDLGWGIINAGAAVAAIRDVDGDPPISRVLVPHVSRTRVITVRWRGHDPRHAGLFTSGIAFYEIYAQDGTHRPRLLARTDKHRLRFRGVPGHHYTFTSFAVDRSGNREIKPALARTRIKLRG